MVLLRHLLGDALRRLRLRQGRTLREVSASARVSLGYLSEVERGQKEASSELLAAICSALGTPLSHVLREVSDNFALAELQSEPVFADVIEPAIEVVGAGHSSGREDASEEQVPVGAGSVAAPAPHGAVHHGPVQHGPVQHGPGQHGPGQHRVAVPAGARMASAGQLGSAQIGAGQLAAARMGTAQAHLGTSLSAPGKITVPAGAALPIGQGVRVGEPAFDQVSRTAREITNMVPV